MADACSPRGLSGSPDERRDSEHPWIYLQTWREHLEVLVGAPPRGKATFPSSCRASTQTAHKTGNLGGPARLVREVEVTHIFMGCHGNHVFSSLSQGFAGKNALKICLSALQAFIPVAAFSPFPMHPSHSG